MRFAAIFACILLAGCVYRIDVQQGNYLTQDAVDKLKVGMTRAEARQVLGTPLLTDVFHADRWDYYFSNMKGRSAAESKLFSVYFKDDKVASFGGTNQPPAPPPVGQTAPPAGAR
jgi:outer membrane protein assembly factor BamE